MKPGKLKIHQNSRHATSVGKDKVYFDNKLKKRPVKLASYIVTYQVKNDKALKVSFMVAEMIAKVGAPQLIGERLLKPVTKMLSRDDNTIPVLNNTIRRRQDEMASDLENQLVSKLIYTIFSLQLTIFNQSLLLTYVRFIDNKDIVEEMLFLKSLETNTGAESIFTEVSSYFDMHNIP